VGLGETVLINAVLTFQLTVSK